jgi:hypothetical protein
MNAVLPTSLFTEIDPPCCSMMWCVPASPIPLPLIVPEMFDAR